MKQPTRADIRNKLIALALFCAIVIIIFLIFFYQSFSGSLQREKKGQSKSLSEVGIAIIEYFHQLEQEGTISTEQAKYYASNSLRNATHGSTGYFWVNSGKGILLMQPHTPERVGIDQTEWTDINNKYIFKDFIRKAKAGGGWVEYYWPKPTTKKEYAKISYVSYFEPWDWVLGTGLYLDDMKKNVFRVVSHASGFFMIAFSILIILAVVIAKYFIGQLEGLAVKDHLTGLFTKRFLQETIPSILKKDERLKDKLLTTIFIDIDHFKKINDTYGHSCGDCVLAEIAETLQKNTRPDDLCIRYGGEEFLIIGFFSDEETITKFTERIRKTAAELIFTKKDITFSTTLSAGIATFNKQETFDNMLIRADANLYKAKEKGRNCIVFEE